MDDEPKWPDFGDYDSNPDRFRVGSECPRKYGEGDVHEPVAERIVREGLQPVLDLGCGEGRLCRLLWGQEIEAVGLDRSPTMLSAVPGPCVLGDASSLPFRAGCFGAVAALYMLYHLPEPGKALAECHRVLHPGGLFVTAAPSRHSDPELAEVRPPRRSTFDAEDAPDLVAGFFAGVEVETWDAPLVRLPTVDAVAECLLGKGIPAGECRAAAERLGAPLTLTKRGCLVWGYKRP
jgi:SAM-dependent methyltransferase